MGQILHKRAKTTYAIREELQRSKASIKELSRLFNLNPKTVAKWRNRSSVEDAPMGAKKLRTVLTKQEEMMICAFRQKTLLPLDDCYVALKESISVLTRSNLHRCLKRYGLNKLPKEAATIKKQSFKQYDIGYFHIDICEVQTAEKKAYLYVAIDRTCKFAYAELYDSPTSSAASTFLKNLIFAVPYKIHTILTDNGIQFSYSLLKYKPKAREHDFEAVCLQYNIKHRLTKVKHPWTNGQVERMNRTIKDATVKTYHYQTIDQLKQHLYDFLMAYNYAKKLKTLKFLTPMQKILSEYTLNPNLFYSNPNHYLLGLNT
jgi:transposase-like protein